MSPVSGVSVDESAGQRPLGLRDFALLLLQLAVLGLVVRQFRLAEFHHLPVLMAIVFSGFVVHAWLPLRYRLPFFLALSTGCVIVVFGPAEGALLLLVGGMLIGIATQPMSFRYRVALLLLAAAVLIVLRDRVTAPFWMGLGSMFMFRLISYVFCVRREGTSAPLLMTCSYFFLLPNVFFALFPVVDYTTFCQSYYNDERRRIYQSGIHWLGVGIVELILYRLVKYELLPSPLEIRTGRSLALFLATNYALYLYVSGTFHIIGGMLHLFGFHLPRTHDNYFLASSFTDIWRRINIYWKDFLMKVLFFPAVYVLRSYGLTPAIAAAVIWVFFWTWLAHAWQQYWLLGVFPLRTGEAALWLAAGVIVAVNAVLDYRGTTRSKHGPADFRMARSVVHGLKVIGVFGCVSLFWTRWTHPEIFEAITLSLADHVLRRTPQLRLELSMTDAAVLGGSVFAALLTGVAFQYIRSRVWTRVETPAIVSGLFGKEQLRFDESVGLHLVPAICLLILAQPPVHSLLGGNVSQTIARLQTEQVTHSEVMAAVHGYYEQLSEGSVHAGPILADPRPPQSGEVFRFGDMTRRRPDLMEKELIPGWRGSYAGGTITINRWGMRDRDRELRKPAGTMRIAIVGSSVIMGAGVDDDETVSRLLETRLNSNPRAAERSYEVLNFGMGQYSAVHRRAQTQHKVLPFALDFVVYCAHQEELDVTHERVATAVHHHVDLEDACIDALVQRMGISAVTPETFLEAKIRPHLTDILRCTYAAIAEDCRSANVKLLYVYLPLPGEYSLAYDPTIVLDVAAAAGISTVDLTGWWGAHSAGDVLNTQRGDYHPNALGHRLMAEALEDVLLGTESI